MFAPGDLAAVPYLLRLDKAANGGAQKERAFHQIRNDYSYLDESALHGVCMCVGALGALGALGEATTDKLALKGLCQSKIAPRGSRVDSLTAREVTMRKKLLAL